jgi:hypothetical protein
VDAVVELPGGAYPSSCLPFYDVDYGHFLDYIEAVEDGRLAEYVSTHIDGARAGPGPLRPPSNGR